MSISRALLSAVNKPAWDIKGARLKQSLTIADVSNVFFKPDGLVMFALIVSGTQTRVYQYSLSTAWDISTASYIKQGLFSGGFPTGLFIRNDGGSFDGKYIYTMATLDDTIYAYVLTNAWDIGAKSASTNIDVGSQVPSPYGLFVKPDGSRFYIAEDQSGSVNNVNQWDSSIFGGIGNASYAGFASTVLQNTGPRDIWFKPDGLKMYATNVVDGIIQEYDLSTDWDVTTASYSNVSLDVGSGGITPNGIFMRDDGRKMYIVDSATDTIHEYNM